MKIAEIIQEDLTAGSSEGSGAVGGSSVDSMMLHPERPERGPKRQDDKIPQVGYGIKIGNKEIPTPRYNADNDLGQSNRVIGG